MRKATTCPQVWLRGQECRVLLVQHGHTGATCGAAGLGGTADATALGPGGAVSAELPWLALPQKQSLAGSNWEQLLATHKLA